jgi:transcription elongation factor Elf1
MPKYNFTCSHCGTKRHKYVSVNVETVFCKTCGGDMQRDLPNISGNAQVTEVIDSYTGVSLDQNHKELVKDRRDQYFWEVEVPRLVQTMSVETCLENGWLVYDDRGDLVINKPPSKR